MSNLIYALKCPFTNNIHYIGKSTSGIVRPSKHLSDSHSEKIKEWVEDLRKIGHKPGIEVLEYVGHKENIDSRERFHIQYHLQKGAMLLNSVLVNPLVLNKDIDSILNSKGIEDIREISETIKIKRKQVGLTQREFAEKAGIALTVLRKIEQGKTNLSLGALINILSMFGLQLTVKRYKSEYS
jgi:y4mF family transcriptional regulator